MTDTHGWTEEVLRAAHKASSLSVAKIQASAQVGCFSCEKVFASSEVVDNDDFAVCPYCGIDAILPEREVPNTHVTGFLTAMNRHWF